MIYLASPYSHEDQSVREIRFQAACLAAAHLISEGNVVFSPVVYGHPLSKQGVPIEWKFWERFCRKQIRMATEMQVLCIAGWEASVGIKEEIWIAELQDKPIHALNPRLVPSLAGLPCVATKREVRT